MPAQNRVEKHKGVTLVVQEGWATLVWDATGHTVGGPVETDDEVRRMTRIAIATLKMLSQRSE